MSQQDPIAGVQRVGGPDRTVDPRAFQEQTRGDAASAAAGLEEGHTAVDLYTADGYSVTALEAKFDGHTSVESAVKGMARGYARSGAHNGDDFTPEDAEDLARQPGNPDAFSGMMQIGLLDIRDPQQQPINPQPGDTPRAGSTIVLLESPRDERGAPTRSAAPAATPGQPPQQPAISLKQGLRMLMGMTQTQGMLGVAPGLTPTSAVSGSRTLGTTPHASARTSLPVGSGEPNGEGEIALTPEARHRVLKHVAAIRGKLGQ